MKLIEINDDKQVQEVAVMAHEIWTEHFTPILKPGQVDYMVAKFQSYGAIGEQIKSQGYTYYIFVDDEEREVGYMAVRVDDADVFLSKLYVRKEYRGNKYARQAFDFLVNKYREHGYRSIWLTVNRYNVHTVSIYKKMGFVILREEDNPIGGGYVMNDYIMEYVLN